MLFDKENLFSDEQAITADAASTNIIDCTGKIGTEIAFGTPLPLRIQVVEDFNNLTSLEIKVETDDNASFSSAKTLATTGAVTLTNLKAGYVAPIVFVPAGNEGYLRLNYDVTGTAPTTGKITAGIVAANDNSYQNM